MIPLSQSRHLIAVLIFAAAAAISGYLAVLDDRPSDSQIAIATAALKRQQQDLFKHDLIFGESNLWRFHTPAFQGLLELALVPTGYEYPLLPFEMLTGVVVMVYLCGMYALLYRQCRSWSISAFVAVLSATVTYTIGPAYWGVGSLASVTPRTLCLALTPLIVLALLRYERQWRLLLVFAFVGLCGNLDMVAAMNLAVVLLIVYLGRQRFVPACWPMAAGCALSALAGALPYALYYFALRASMMPPEGPVSAAAVSEAFRVGEFAVLYPDLLKSLMVRGLRVLMLAIPAGAVLSRVERFRLRDFETWLWLTGAGLFVAFGLHGLCQLVGVLRAKSPPVIDFFQASSLVMLPLYVLFAQALTDLFRLFHRHRGLLRWACAALMALWMVPSDNLRVLRHAGYNAATVFLDEADKPRKVQRHRERYRRHAELKGIAKWAREHSDTSAVFIVDSSEFRLLARRAIVASESDVKTLYNFAPGRLELWLRRVGDQAELLPPPSGTADGEALKAFKASLAGLEYFRGAKEWYVIMPAGVALDKPESLEPVPPAGGRYYQTYRLR